jgi:hypothetical protein
MLATSSAPRVRVRPTMPWPLEHNPPRTKQDGGARQAARHTRRKKRMRLIRKRGRGRV